MSVSCKIETWMRDNGPVRVSDLDRNGLIELINCLCDELESERTSHKDTLKTWKLCIQSRYGWSL